MKLLRVCCSKYSDLDDLVMTEASNLGLPLIGGTALEVIANKANHPGVRKRSDNDLDYLTTDYGLIGAFQDFLDKHIDPNKVKVDIYTDAPSNYRDYILDYDGVLVMSPAYLIWSKLQRASEKDINDIKWLLSLPQSVLSDDDLSQCLNDLGITEKELNLLQSLL